MFKWVCLGVAVVFLTALAWMINDLRLEVRRSAQTVQGVAQSVNEHLPAIVEKSRKSTEVLAEHLPEIVEKTRTTAETLAELAEDIRQLKELAGMSHTPRDQNLVAYANGALNAIESSGGTIGLRKSGGGLKSPLPAKEWAVGARKEALFLTVVAKSKKELLTRLTKNKFGSSWYIQVGDKEAVPLVEWLQQNHAATRELVEVGL
jgi:hypothetical protein